MLVVDSLLSHCIYFDKSWYCYTCFSYHLAWSILQWRAIDQKLPDVVVVLWSSEASKRCGSKAKEIPVCDLNKKGHDRIQHRNKESINHGQEYHTICPREICETNHWIEWRFVNQKRGHCRFESKKLLRWFAWKESREFQYDPHVLCRRWFFWDCWTTNIETSRRIRPHDRRLPCDCQWHQTCPRAVWKRRRNRRSVDTNLRELSGYNRNLQPKFADVIKSAS